MTLWSFVRGTDRDPRWMDAGLLVLRVGMAFAVIWRHGYGKLPALLTNPDQFFDPIGIGPTASLALATFAELVCALLVALGAFGRLPSLILTMNFAVIVIFLHEAQVPGDRGELALLYLVAFAALTLTGPGRYGIGALAGRSRTQDPG